MPACRCVKWPDRHALSACRRAGNSIEGIYIQKTREVINGMRSTTGQRDDQWASIAESLKNTVIQRPGAKA